MRKWGISLMVAALLTGAVGCQATTVPGRGSLAGPSGQPAPKGPKAPATVSLTGTQWRLTTIVEPSRTWSPPATVDATIHFDDKGRFGARACNSIGGTVRIDSAVLRFGQRVSTSMACLDARGPVEQAFNTVVHDQVRWRIVGDELRLEQGDRSLRFKPSPGT